MNLYIFRGLGWLVIVVFMIGWAISKYIIVSVWGADFYRASIWPEMISILFGCVAVTAAGFYFNSNVRPMVYEKDTGEPIRCPSHTLLFIPFEYWGIIILAINVFDKYNSLT